eukprot:6189086-Prymnesium_polylepis.1
MSSPLILGFDLRNDETVKQFWPFLANTEAIAVHQAWAGHPGWRVRTWTPDSREPIWYQERDIDTENVFTAKHPIKLMHLWTKPMANGSQAVLIINADASATTSIAGHPYSFSLADLGMPMSLTVRVRDIWGRRDRGVVEPPGGEKNARTVVEGHVPGLASEFLMLTPTIVVHSPPPPPPPSSPPPRRPLHVGHPPPSPMPPMPALGLDILQAA